MNAQAFRAASLPPGLVNGEGVRFSNRPEVVARRIDEPVRTPDYGVNAVVACNRVDQMLQLTSVAPYIVIGGSKTDPSPMTCKGNPTEHGTHEGQKRHRRLLHTGTMCLSSADALTSWIPWSLGSPPQPCFFSSGGVHPPPNAFIRSTVYPRYACRFRMKERSAWFSVRCASSTSRYAE